MPVVQYSVIGRVVYNGALVTYEDLKVPKPKEKLGRLFCFALLCLVACLISYLFDKVFAHLLVCSFDLLFDRLLAFLSFSFFFPFLLRPSPSCRQ